MMVVLDGSILHVVVQVSKHPIFIEFYNICFSNSNFIFYIVRYHQTILPETEQRSRDVIGLALLRLRQCCRSRHGNRIC